jgi:hypothetical protein
MVRTEVIRGTEQEIDNKYSIPFSYLKRTAAKGCLPCAVLVDGILKMLPDITGINRIHVYLNLASVGCALAIEVVDSERLQFYTDDYTF